MPQTLVGSFPDRSSNTGLDQGRANAQKGVRIPYTRPAISFAIFPPPLV